MTRPIKFRGRDINGRLVFGLLTKKKLRNSGNISWAIATGNCTLGETVPVNENSIAQLVGYDATGNEIYEGDRVISQAGYEYTAQLHTYPALNDFTLKEISQ